MYGCRRNGCGHPSVLLALLIDHLYFVEGDNIMNIEPAILIMVRFICLSTITLAYAHTNIYISHILVINRMKKLGYRLSDIWRF